mmetsp:Transcript_17642/g.38898  ORF Transcript_17642/g.38898 Transcript_17642/m.38898 type:complete len:296 (-) Transcript_17642:149-1036(-)
MIPEVVEMHRTAAHQHADTAGRRTTPHTTARTKAWEARAIRTWLELVATTMANTPLHKVIPMAQMNPEVTSPCQVLDARSLCSLSSTTWSRLPRDAVKYHCSKHVSKHTATNSAKRLQQMVAAVMGALVKSPRTSGVVRSQASNCSKIPGSSQTISSHTKSWTTKRIHISTSLSVFDGNMVLRKQLQIGWQALKACSQIRAQRHLVYCSMRITGYLALISKLSISHLFPKVLLGAFFFRLAAPTWALATDMVQSFTVLPVGFANDRISELCIAARCRWGWLAATALFHSSVRIMA